MVLKRDSVVYSAVMKRNGTEAIHKFAGDNEVALLFHTESHTIWDEWWMGLMDGTLVLIDKLDVLSML